MVVYDISDKESFNNVKFWIGEIEKYGAENVNLILVGNKCDLGDKRKVQFEEGQSLVYIQNKIAKELKCQFIETSAKNDINIEKSFVQIAKNVLQEKLQNLEMQNKQKVTKGLKPSNPLADDEKQKSGGGCC